VAIHWYVSRRKENGEIHSYFSDDRTDPKAIPIEFEAVGPYDSQLAAQQAHQPRVIPEQVAILATLSAKPSEEWTLKDVADWLKAKG
jgi:hypothetical protein